MRFIKNVFGRPNTKNNKWLENPEMLDEAVLRNEKAQRFQKRGLIGAAIPLYEKSVQELFCYELPYRKLYSIYMRQNRIEDALWVCETYINNPYRLTGGLRHWMIIRQILRLRTRKSRQNTTVNIKVIHDEE